jgi:hypothetical protein
MMMRNAWLGLALMLVGAVPGAVLGDDRAPDRARLRAEVERLASPEFQGRRGAGGRKTADHLVDTFRALKLEPLFDGEYTQAIPDREPGRTQGRNVGARLVGSDPELRDEWVIVAAHYDHLGVRNGVLYPGADDNASGVAMMLEVARAMKQGAQPPKRSLMFIGFDLEEIGLYGSRYFVEHSPVPLEKVALFVTADMIGRALGGICDDYVFVMGSEHAPEVRPWITRAARERPVTVGMLGTDLMLLDRIDYGPFRARQVPYLFFSTGENPTYHTPRDTPETLDYAKLEAVSRIILDVVRSASDASTAPKWAPTPEHGLAEVATVRDLLRLLLDRRDELKIGGTQLFLMSNAARKLDAILERGSITPGERAGMVNIARLVMVAVL